MKLADIRQKLGHGITLPLIRVLSRSGITPNALTFLSLAVSLGAAYVVATGHFLVGGILVLVSGIFDLLDGALARFTGQSTKMGALLDSTFDRISEAAVLFGLMVWYVRDPAGGSSLEIGLIFAVLVGSFLVSYIKARAEGLGWQCGVGLFTRSERVIVLAVALLVNQILIGLSVLTVFVFVTAAQRLVHVYKQSRTGG